MLIISCSCERENRWLDEAPYYIDTSCVPRGGGRRRKSMEPKALANLNGMIVSSPVKGSRDTHVMPSTPMNRRDSTIWMRTPPEQLGIDADADGEYDDMADWAGVGMLTPVPKTPAPESIAQFAANVTPETPFHGDEDEQTRQMLLMRTCPPANNQATGPYADMGRGVLGEDKDPNVMMRLMAARRKSLQYAPKIGSPLAKTWSG
jgi:hypothetical protein